MNANCQTAIIKGTSINTIYNDKQEEMLMSHSLWSHLEIRFYAKGCPL